MRIAVLTSSYPRFPGDGTAPFIQSLAEGLASLGHAVEVIAPYDPEVSLVSFSRIPIHRFHYALMKRLNIMGHGRALEADVHLRPVAFLLIPFYTLSAILTLWKVTRQQKTEVIHVHWVLPNGPIAAIVAKLRCIPFIISLHGSDMYLAGKNRYFGLVARWVFSQAQAVTACSPELKERAIALGAPESTELLAWGADPSRFIPVTDRNELRSRLGWEDGLCITTLGRMVYKKGFSNLLKALPTVLDKYPQVKVIFGGDGPLLKDLKATATALSVDKSVQFMGRIPWHVVPDFLAAADIFALPSVRDVAGNLDGLPTVLLEAMSCGTAVIASDIGGVSLAVRDFENGLLVESGSVQGLIEKISLLIDDQSLRERLGKAARQTIVNELNWTNVAYKIERLLYSACAMHSKTRS